MFAGAPGATPAAPLRRSRALGCCFWSTVTCRTGAPARGRSSTAPLRCLSGSAQLRLRDPHGGAWNQALLMWLL